MDARLIIAILVGKIIAFLNKLTGSGATAAPGLIALKIDPNLVKKLTKQFKYGSIVISGTNGKTTTARLTADILSSRYQIIHNRAGSNLLRGIASTLVTKSSLAGKIPANLAIWEVDEATVPEAIETTSPKIIILLNLFRDQLDRYGEVDSVRAKWQKAISQLNSRTILILNADDPGVSFLAKSFKGKVAYFGVNDQKINLSQIDHVADIRHCLNCGSTLNYSALLSAHMGHYSCPKCGFDRSIPNVSASGLKFNPDFSTRLNLTIVDRQLTIDYKLPGLYNVYNVLAAAACAATLEISLSPIKQGLKNFSAAFGRFQSVRIPASPAGGRNRSAVIFLIKNPAGANEVIRTLAAKDNLNILAILNDNIADGRDVSWIWDTNWELLANKVKTIQVSGIRAWDLATRLKYAGFKLSKDNIYKEISYSITKSLDNLNTNDTLMILPTYTALLEVQKSLSILTRQKWHEN